MSKYGIWAIRSSGSIFGAAEAWCKDLDGDYIVLDTVQEARQLADEYNSKLASANVYYQPKEMEMQLAMDILERRAQNQESAMEMEP